MSTICVGFKANGAFLGWYPSEERIVEALSPSEMNWTECTYNDLAYGRDRLLQERKLVEKEILRLEKTAQRVIKLSDLTSVYEDIDRQKDILEEIIVAIAQIDMLIKIQDEGAGKDRENPLQWCYM